MTCTTRGMTRRSTLALVIVLCATGALSACASEDLSVWHVTPEGGSHAFPSGIEVTFPSNAIETETDVRADNLEHGALPATKPGSPAPIGSGFELDVGGATLIAPVEVAAAQPTDAAQRGGVVYLAAFDEGQAAWVAAGGNNEPGDALLRGPAFRAGRFAILEWTGGDVDQAMQPILDGIFAPAPAGVAPPECADAGKGMKIESPPDAALLTCMESSDTGSTVKARNNRTYPVTATLPSGATVDPVPAGSLDATVWRALPGATGPNQVVIPPGAEAMIHLADIKAGEAVQIASTVDGVAYTAAVLDAVAKADRRTAQVVGEADRFETVAATADLATCFAGGTTKVGAELAAGDVAGIADAASGCATDRFGAAGGDTLVSVRAVAPATKTRIATRTATGETIAASYKQQTAQPVTAAKEKPKPPACDGAAIYSHSILREDIPDEELPAHTKQITYAKCVDRFAAIKMRSTLYYLHKTDSGSWVFMGQREADGTGTDGYEMSGSFGLNRQQFEALTPQSYMRTYDWCGGDGADACGE